ncbi:RNA methyltransferase [Plesiocystis pacifica SIR-1]|uniref:RNA methyltransferase n=1 Tax=Plesiocystis pacifica SIR-1 TaxID=391625 RepID=A6G9S9_9BACT|nr:class I SAM-dependent RNA methyltransferase [Plesiocystis pacifica]EDM77365.1 RNA methyltransferase [Plesiocystis pacifica SIR-1]
MAESSQMEAVELTVRIHDLAHGGAGVGRPESETGTPEGEAETRVCFVDGALPGERVRMRVDTENKRWLRGHCVEVLEAAPERSEAPCALADRCGGCGWQHVEASAQAKLKAKIVEGQLRRLPVVVAESLPSPSPLGYRRRARVHYRKTAAGLELGFYGQRSHAIVDCATCPVLDPALDWAVQQVRAWAQWLPERGEVVGLSNGSEVVLGLPGVRHDPELEAAIRAVLGEPKDGEDSEESKEPVLLGVQLRGGRERVGVGRTHLELDGDGPTPPVSQGPFTFSQAQAAQNRNLVEHVAARVRESGRDARVLELHAGVGNFSRVLARSAKAVWAVDGDREAIANLQRTAERWGLRINAKRGQAERLLAKLATSGRRYDVVVLDPPRSGIGEAAARDLLSVVRDRVVYVSCDPATLARDLAVLLAEGSGLELADLRVFDMMPMTPEVEVVATLNRVGPSPEPPGRAKPGGKGKKGAKKGRGGPRR